MNTKTAMILAAGRGERMRPLTDTIPKPLLQIRGRAMIDYHLRALQLAGIENVVINHAWLGEQIEQTVGQGQEYGLNICYSPEGQALETAGGIVRALPLLTRAGDDEFLVVNGDIYTDFDFTCIEGLQDGDLAHLVLVDNPSHNPAGDFGLHNRRVDNGPTERFTFCGIALYHKHFFDGYDEQKRALGPVLRQVASANKISGQYHAGEWHDVGTPQRLQQLN